MIRRGRRREMRRGRRRRRSMATRGGFAPARHTPCALSFCILRIPRKASIPTLSPPPQRGVLSHLHYRFPVLFCEAKICVGSSTLLPSQLSASCRGCTQQRACACEGDGQQERTMGKRMTSYTYAGGFKTTSCTPCSASSTATPCTRRCCAASYNTGASLPTPSCSCNT